MRGAAAETRASGDTGTADTVPPAAPVAESLASAPSISRITVASISRDSGSTELVELNRSCTRASSWRRLSSVIAKSHFGNRALFYPPNRPLVASGGMGEQRQRSALRYYHARWRQVAIAGPA